MTDNTASTSVSDLKFLYSLKEIAQWNDTDSEVNVPALQRGLVWKARQMELLWDSILRGFPIGSFVIASFPETDQKEALHLLDGQQRMNTIKLGFQGIPRPGKELAVLWIDLKPNEHVGSTRRYWIKACTPAHPWGYNNNDNCTQLSAGEKRSACEKYKPKDKNKFRPDTANSWPEKAVLPIPLSILVQAAFEVDSEEEFSVKALELLAGQIPPDHQWRDTFSEHLAPEDGLAGLIQDLSSTFLSIRKYRVSTAFLPRIFDAGAQSSTDQHFEQIEEVECLFDRMNTLGTRMSASDLSYSVIKAHFPPELKKVNERISESLMPASHMIMLAFRLALSPRIEGNDAGMTRLQPSLSLAKIRKIARERAKEWDYIIALFSAENNSIVHITYQLKEFLKYPVERRDLGDNRIPAALLLKIILHSPDIFLLLMWLVRADHQNKLDRRHYLQLATLIHWFAHKKHEVCNAVVESCIRRGSISVESIREALYTSVHRNWLRIVYPPTVSHGDRWNWSNKWRWWDVWGHTPYWDWLSHFREEKEILLYAQRHYLADNFQGYDPANAGLTAENNRPWDMDHIIPRNWISGKQAPERDFCKQWLNNIGNFAAIPFEKNRSKSDVEDWDEYIEHSKTLLFDERFTEVSQRVTYDSAVSRTFAEVVRDRMMNIYSSWYDGLRMVELLQFDTALLPESIAERRSLFLTIQRELQEGAECFFVQGDREYLIESGEDIHFCKDWITVGTEASQCLICMTSNGHLCEIGIRKAPKLGKVDQNYREEDMKCIAEDLGYNHQNSGWWYVVKTFTEPPDASTVVAELTRLKEALFTRGS